MKVKVQRILKTILFCVLVLAMLNFITRLFTPKWLENRWASAKTNETFYELEDNSIDVGFYGSSVVAAAVDPFQIYKEEGISSYNFGVMSQNMMGTYFWVKESLRTQKPKVVCVEVKAAGRTQDKDQDKARKSYDYMEWSKNKIQYAYENEHTYHKDELWDYLFPLAKYHDRWQDLIYDDFDFISGNYISYTRGMVTLTSECREKDPELADTQGIKLDPKDIKTDFNRVNEAYLRRIITDCQEQGIKVILFKTPDSNWTTKKHNHIVEIANSYKDVDFLDLSTRDWFEGQNFVYATEASDYYHVNLIGTKKVSAYLGAYLKKHCDLPDRRQDSKISKVFDRELKDYECVYEDAMLNFETNPTKFFQKLKQDRYAVLVSSGKSIAGHYSEEEKSALKALGISDKFFNVYEGGSNAIAILDGKHKETLVSQITEEKPQLNTNTALSNGVPVKIVSGKNASSIIIGGTEEVVDVSGVNLIVYDKQTKTVGDSVSITLDSSGKIVLKRKVGR